MNSSDVLGQEHRESGDVVVAVTGCPKEDARTVFDVLRRAFVSDRPASDTPEDASTTRPTVWTATVDVSETLAGARPAQLSAPVTVEAQGGYWAVDRLREHLADTFSVRVVGTAAGDQEQEIRLRLESRGPA
ncbi:MULTISPECIES: hypothetical protein [Streptomyces]|uniref:Uncharacterized protein n=1 Tax=Streptomyces clavifer TaxID=68188 RepID=A0ABS4VGX2_9ACTN|nr:MULTISPECIES: hypothetical protein [Streptomyces]KQX91567.1 hypothetical protein ASD26_23805 [Streptomyces sp. Root1319]KQZ20128.1 hypothetical protein ASD51_25335 [Streptomyces sp. Root55]MBP2363170.1 hypothetical protein [Streptomyces clavifer]MDX2743135.1 hypothetical protein [Streptomyces sp. NRRL_B-2557]RPK72508.1 hypothetical protein EES45_32775 [Streptomyces sp. ADI97-07]